MGSIQNYALPITHKIYIISSFKIHTVNQKNKTIITTKKKDKGYNRVRYQRNTLPTVVPYYKLHKSKEQL